MLLYDTFIMVIIIIGSKTAGGTVLEVTQTNNIEAINGSTVEITCNTNGTSGSINWYVLDHSSLNVGDNLTSRCTFLLGICLPAVVGRYTFSISGSNILASISDLDLSDENYWICAQNSDPSDVKNLKLEVKVPITDISMNTSGNVTVLEGSEQRLSCTTTYGRPAADITFIKVINGITTNLQNPGITYNQSGDQFTTGLLTYQPTINDTGATISCLANNTLTQGTVTSSNTLILTVQGSTTTTTTAVTSTSTISTTTNTAIAPPTSTTFALKSSTSDTTQLTTIEGNGDISSTDSSSSTTTPDKDVSGSDNSRIVLIVVSSSVGSCILIIIIALCVFRYIRLTKRKTSIDTNSKSKTKHAHDPNTRSEHVFSHGIKNPPETIINTYPRNFEHRRPIMNEYYSKRKAHEAREGYVNYSPNSEYDGYSFFRGHYNTGGRYGYSRTYGDGNISQGRMVTRNPLYTEHTKRHFDVNNTDHVVEHNGSRQQQFGYPKRPYQTNVLY